ncbi:hypothetical protein GLOIN_2v1878621 [Rhizophagus clarus]|uniref:F-box domain-containing protein n=1 Tax=Rhizophagus clarus TaxID=94130 RepID=A0A8H3LVG5_9GLOM|nr:hypothetical protein GLOIN_2v1878621 [Rhizophagus clarus]
MRKPLPSLCLEKIFWEIYNGEVINNDPLSTILDIRNTLFNCLLVNRDFCRHVIPILWRNTFNWYLPSSKLIISYLYFLSSESRFNLTRRLNIDISGLLDSSNKRRPFFNYSSYLRELEYHSVFKSVQELWPKETTRERNQQNIEYQLIMAEEICKMFLIQCPTLYRLDLATDLNFLNPFKFTSLTSTKSCLIKLREFKCSDHPDQVKIFNILSNTCHNIEKMQLGIFRRNFNDKLLYEGIRQLLRSQRYLKEFICSFAQKGFISIIGPVFPISLQEVTLHACDLDEEVDPFDYFMECHNLTTLTLIDCNNLQGSHLTALKNLKKMKLNIVYNKPIQYYDVKSIIIHSNITLTNLLLDDIIEPYSLIEDVTNYCPNIIHLRANISANVLPQIPLLFKSLKKLEIIELRNEKTFYENLVPITISNELAIEISRSIPSTLYSFTFLLMGVFNSQSLALFLEQLDERSIIMSDTSYDNKDEYIDDEYIDDEYIDIEMNQVIFEEFYIRIDLDEYNESKELDE